MCKGEATLLLRKLISATCICDLILLVTSQPQLVTTGEGVDVDWLVNWELRFYGQLSFDHNGLTMRPNLSVNLSSPIVLEQDDGTTSKSPNKQAPSPVNTRTPIPAYRLSMRTTPDWNRVQALSSRLVPEPKLWYQWGEPNHIHLSTSHTLWEVTFHVPVPNHNRLGLDWQGLCSWLHPKHIGDKVGVSLLRALPGCSLWAKSWVNKF